MKIKIGDTVEAKDTNLFSAQRGKTFVSTVIAIEYSKNGDAEWFGLARLSDGARGRFHAENVRAN